MSPTKKLLAALAGTPFELFQKDFLLTWKESGDNIRSVLLAAELLERLYHENVSTRVFQSGLAVSCFRDNSTRTRFAFASAANLLGLTAQDLDEGKSQVAHGETVRETANMISFCAEAIGIRDDIFIGEGHEYMKQVSEAVEDGFRIGVLPQRPAVINLQCDRDHPTQAMADLLHLASTFGGLEHLRGKRIAMSWAYSPSYGKPLSVPQGVIALMTRFGMDVVLSHPAGYDLLPEPLEAARANAAASGGKFTTTHSMDEAFDGADIVYPKSWAPFAIMKERTRLLRSGEADKLKALEREALAENAKHTDWECTEARMARTRDRRALYMHCLPADISGVSCKQGEVAASVFDRYRKETYQEAGHKPFVIAAMILLTRIPEPARVLEGLLAAGTRRRA